MALRGPFTLYSHLLVYSGKEDKAMINIYQAEVSPVRVSKQVKKIYISLKARTILVPPWHCCLELLEHRTQLFVATSSIRAQCINRKLFLNHHYDIGLTKTKAQEETRKKTRKPICLKNLRVFLPPQDPILLTRS